MTPFCVFIVDFDRSVTITVTPKKRFVAFFCTVDVKNISGFFWGGVGDRTRQGPKL